VELVKKNCKNNIDNIQLCSLVVRTFACKAW